jgi:DNA-binding beta-propeller fold protein YncE
MNRKTATILIVTIILVFIGYIVFDIAFKKEPEKEVITGLDTIAWPEKWEEVASYESSGGKLTSVAAGKEGYIILAGESFVECLNRNMNVIWKNDDTLRFYSVAIYNDTIYAATRETIHLFSIEGKMLDEWGPYEDNALITSISAGRGIIAFADASNKILVILDKRGRVISITGVGTKEFIIPSPYFDVAVGGNDTVYVANTGHRRVETRTSDGKLLGWFGEAGSAPDAFCGCCNPAHFTTIAGGFVTAEKGINRIKILDKKGRFKEFVSAENDFFASIPLDIAVDDELTIYAANPQDSKLYIFKRIE